MLQRLDSNTAEKTTNAENETTPAAFCITTDPDFFRDLSDVGAGLAARQEITPCRAWDRALAAALEAHVVELAQDIVASDTELADVVARATAAERWDIVSRAAGALEARRRARAGVGELDAEHASWPRRVLGRSR